MITFMKTMIALICLSVPSNQTYIFTSIYINTSICNYRKENNNFQTIMKCLCAILILKNLNWGNGIIEDVEYRHIHDIWLVSSMTGGRWTWKWYASSQALIFNKLHQERSKTKKCLSRVTLICEQLYYKKRT